MVEHELLICYWIFFNKLLQYNYFKFQYMWLYDYTGKSKFKMRLNAYDKTIQNNVGFFGFKFQFKGRFSRKQRSANIWVQKGTMPFNTITTRIQFAFYTIPLINSAMTVRVWLHKGFKELTEFLQIG